MFSYILKWSLTVTIRLSLDIDEQLRYANEGIYCVALNEMEPLILVSIEPLHSKECRSNDLGLVMLFLMLDVSHVGNSGTLILIRAAE